MQKALQGERKAREEAEKDVDCVKIELEGWGRFHKALRVGMPST